MGTRSITHVFNGDDLLVSIYRQYDGYPSGHGRDIMEAIGKRKLVNGIRGGDEYAVNGMGNAAAILIAYLKSDLEAGSIYIEKPDAEHTEEYTYYITGSTYDVTKGINLKVIWYGDEPIYDGPIADFDPDMTWGEDED